MKSSDCLLLVFVIAVFPLFTFAQTPKEHNTNHGLRFIPQPQKVIIKPGLFEWPEGISIILSKNAEQAEAFAAMQLADEIEAVLGEKPLIQHKGRGIHLGLIGRDRRLARDFGKEDLLLGNEGYFLEIQKDRIVCLANTSRGLFYAVQTLKQLIRANMSLGILPQLRITDWPAFPLRGWCEDAADTLIPNMDFLKSRIRVNSEFKMNYFMLYLNNDIIGEVNTEALAVYAETHHVQLRIINSFAHSGEAGMEKSHSLVHWEIENSRIWPDFQSYIADAAAMSEERLFHHASGLLFKAKNSTGEYLLANHWFPMLWTAENAWNPVIAENGESIYTAMQKRLRKFDLSFDPLFFHHEGFEITGLMHVLSRLGRLHSGENLSRKAFWRELNKEDNHSADSLDLHILHEEAKAIASELKGMIQRAGRLKKAVTAAHFAAKRIQAFAEKKRLEKEWILYAKSEHPDDETRKRLGEKIELLVSEILALKQEYINLRLFEKDNLNASHIEKYDRLAEHVRSLLN